ncbi:Enkurin [Cryptotermes secundus]|uniref:Enkurin n=1 Tax=Cryptotermes secundus TaxID=105785 RepID=A0A2J7QDR7_9NEOP|nr:enkurin isoform X1 [Cryptotermes secundus]PNF26726.1 Enkurin [Cryptotermes secundus]
MSTVLLTAHDENIYNIIKKEDAKPSPKISAKPPFITKLLEAEGKRNKCCHKTFGFAKVPLNTPSEYLKKNSRILPHCPKIEEPRCLLSQRLPKIPTRIQAAKKQQDKQAEDASQCCSYPVVKEEIKPEAKQDLEQTQGNPKRKGKDRHNYCHQNIVQAVRLVPHQPKHNYVDTKKGDAHALQSSGLEPHYILRKTFGKNPNYLHHCQLRADAPEKEKETEKKQFKVDGRYITERERKALLQGLKHNREELQKAYQLLPILTDTVTKKKNKIKLEEELKQLESSISTLECHPYIYVTDATCSEFGYDPDSNEMWSKQVQIA